MSLQVHHCTHYDGKESLIIQPSFVEIGQPVAEKRFLRVTYMGMAAILVMYLDLFFGPSKEFHIKFGFDWPSGLREDL